MEALSRGRCASLITGCRRHDSVPATPQREREESSLLDAIADDQDAPRAAQRRANSRGSALPTAFVSHLSLSDSRRCSMVAIFFVGGKKTLCFRWASVVEST
jgi:hypothetical protein